eukprot:jgi/Ulvmu1/1003/UM103_0031.1
MLCDEGRPLDLCIQKPRQLYVGKHAARVWCDVWCDVRVQYVSAASVDARNLTHNQLTACQCGPDPLDAVRTSLVVLRVALVLMVAGLSACCLVCCLGAAES